LVAKTIPALPSLNLITFLEMFCFTKDDVAKVGGMFSKIKLDGGSIMAVMGSTSEKMYRCQVPNFGFEMIKLRPGG
jgi:hypothetical protein